ncbi:MAG: DNA-3-methyladenine glycosylase 2 family protein [Anaerolineae bacterium]|jgi:DNA-3-methyladenine glycosylase II|nr:DNA-3-methyladenine glycosylase 2 family protein [Anaerolineae bacterium]
MPPSVHHDSLTEEKCARAIAELTARAPELATVVCRWGEPPFWTHDPGFAGLVLAILSQQVSLESAEAALAKLERRIELITPERFLTLDDASLREIGFSRQKADYVRGLARAIVSGDLDLDRVGRMADDEVREALMSVKGIGPWTADTYLLFSLRRSDAWPSGDLALAKAIQDLRGLESVPSYPDLDRIAEGWRPWRAVAARILWHHYLRTRGR